MKRLANLSPYQLASIGMFGVTVGGCAFLFLLPTTPASTLWHQFLYWAVCTAIGFYIVTKASEELKQAVISERQPHQTAKLSRILSSRILLTLRLSPVLILLLIKISTKTPHGSSWNGTVFAILLANQLINILAIACHKNPEPESRDNFRSFAPIQSEHWGSTKLHATSELLPAKAKAN